MKPEGWLGLYLQKQAEGLSLHIREVSWPFTEAYWAEEEHADGWWPWEQTGYWIDGALRCALVTGDQQLLQVAQHPVDYTLSHALPDGYLGPALIKNGHESNPATDNFRWPNTVFFRALMAKAEAIKRKYSLARLSFPNKKNVILEIEIPVNAIRDPDFQWRKSKFLGCTICRCAACTVNIFCSLYIQLAI